MNNTCGPYDALMEAIKDMPVVDTHEHLIPEDQRTREPVDFFTVTMSHYAASDLMSAGMASYEMDRLRNAETPLTDKIALFMPFWEKASNTGYCRALKIAARDLYGIDEINADSLPTLSARVAEQNKPGLYKKILEEKCGIKYCLWDQFWLTQPAKDDFFRLALRLDHIVRINGKEGIRRLEESHNLEIKNIGALESVMEIIITQHKSCGLTAIKTGLAYQRTLDFEPVSRAEAMLSMERILRGRFTERDLKMLEDFLMYSLAEKAGWHNLPIQVHTGLLEGNGNDIRHANPALLSSLIAANPNTRFDLFHGGYPFGGELSAMAKMFPNVYLDMAWLHIISPAYARRYLSEWLDTVPMNKIMGFGGDYIFVEGVYGHLQMAKENIAATLAEKVSDGVFTLSEAERCAYKLLYENPNTLFGAME